MTPPRLVLRVELVSGGPDQHRAGVWLVLREEVEEEEEGPNYILHELPADGADLFAECGAEHHHLLLMGGHAKNLLHISTHV